MLDLDSSTQDNSASNERARWVGRTPININHNGTIRSMRMLAGRLEDLGHTADAKTVHDGAVRLGTVIYYLKMLTHEELEWEVADDDPLYVRSLLEDVIAQLPAFHPSYKPAIQLRAAIIARGGE